MGAAGENHPGGDITSIFGVDFQPDFHLRKMEITPFPFSCKIDPNPGNQHDFRVWKWGDFDLAGEIRQQYRLRGCRRYPG